MPTKARLGNIRRGIRRNLCSRSVILRKVKIKKEKLTAKAVEASQAGLIRE